MVFKEKYKWIVCRNDKIINISVFHCDFQNEKYVWFVINKLYIYVVQADEFFLFAGLMAVDMIIFALMAMRYKYVETPSEEDEETLKNSDLALKEKPEKNGLDNAAYKRDD